jgi:hypothetical protein
MNIGLLVVSMIAMLGTQRSPIPDCAPSHGRAAQAFHGSVKAGEGWVANSPAGWILRLAPTAEGWLLQVGARGREGEDLARLTPPFHFTPNPRSIDGWHFRNVENTGPNDGSVNAPQELREFIFSPRVGRDIQGPSATAGPTLAEVGEVRSFGRGWLLIKSYTLGSPRPGERASFQSLEFSGCLTWPANQPRALPLISR